MAAVLGGVQSMFTAAWDEPFALPSEESTTLALRTQQILAYETGVAKVADPLGGSYFVEALTDATEAKIIEIMDDLEEHGGMVRCDRGRLPAGPDRRRGLADPPGRSSPASVPSSGSTGSSPTSRAPDIETYELNAEGRDLQLKRLAKVKAERDPAGGQGRPWRRCPRPPRETTT